MKQYFLSMYQPDGPAPSDDFLDPIMEKLGALRLEIEAAGEWVFSGALNMPYLNTTTVSSKDGETLVTDGPYIEGKEHIGGFYVLRAEDLDGALKWGKRISEITGLPIEVIPFGYVSSE
jgi:hypothetical protein